MSVREASVESRDKCCLIRHLKIGAVAVCNDCETDLHAVTRIQAHVSAKGPSLLATTRATNCSRADVFSLRKVAPHSSAVALWTSGLHFGSVSRKSVHAWSSSTGSIDGMRRYLNNEENVANNAVKVAAERERESRRRRLLRTSGYLGANVVRKSCANFWNRLEKERQLRSIVSDKSDAYSSSAFKASSSADSTAYNH